MSGGRATATGCSTRSPRSSRTSGCSATCAASAVHGRRPSSLRDGAGLPGGGPGGPALDRCARPGRWLRTGSWCVLVNAELRGARDPATHRLICWTRYRCAARAGRGRRPDVAGRSRWRPRELGERLEERREAEAPVFGLVLPGDEGYLLVGDADGLADRMRREPMSAAVRGLDLAVLHVADARGSAGHRCRRCRRGHAPGLH